MLSQHLKPSRIHSGTSPRFRLLALVFILTCKNNFLLFIINLYILSSSQVGFSFHLKEVTKHLHLSLPQHFHTASTNLITIILPNLTGKKSASVEYIIDHIIFKIKSQQICCAHYQPKTSQLTVHNTAK